MSHTPGLAEAVRAALMLSTGHMDLTHTKVSEALEKAGVTELLEALEAISNIAGNLQDSRLEKATGPNDARHRGLMVINAREIARAAIARARGG